MRSRSPSRDGTTREFVLELGSGSLRKTAHILKSMSRLVQGRSPTNYYALDLERRVLEQTLGEIQTSELGQCLDGKVITKGLWGTFNDGIQSIKDGTIVSAESSDTVDDSRIQLHVMFLGLSLGNFPRDEAGAFLRSLPLRPGAGDTLLLSLDHTDDKDKIEVAYNDPQGYCRRFKMNALRHTGRVLGNEKLFPEGDWEYINFYDTERRQHKSYYKARRSCTLSSSSMKSDFHFSENEMLKIEESVKYSEDDTRKLFSEGNLKPIHRWTDPLGSYSVWLLHRPVPAIGGRRIDIRGETELLN
ncbi:hypothetical protein CC1G_07198 [Coprinopsis cinerea okayama7|uniref:Histidine-specific methyltransferase SAM-dependent domain-containing protein n=1 Tax=Coprinopsis cinerea (strain Okayama-7 / 130 / ATCC MYA-4618 / FGSC 9003) TaxID=240176 RepID=A8NRF6_COPC7|nr:hypothetical protein CC1G_07198 [Coprinopsis cinerea okayama7\|eukprot:XP_001835774.2 hypothetical protein CC1G_07198 [Coprinopsis cinerea okayama7\